MTSARKSPPPRPQHMSAALIACRRCRTVALVASKALGHRRVRRRARHALVDHARRVAHEQSRGDEFGRGVGASKLQRLHLRQRLAKLLAHAEVIDRRLVDDGGGVE